VRKQFADFFQAKVVKGIVKAETIQKPHARILDEYSLDASQNDNWILATIKDYMKQNSEEEVALLTADLGMQLRAEAMDIRVIVLDDKYKVDEETDEQKEIRKLKGQLAKYESASPNLSVVFENGKSISIELERPHFEQYVQQEVWKIKNMDYPRVSETDTFSYRLNKEYIRQEAITYNGQLETYYKAYEGYLRERKALYLAETLTLDLDMITRNSGSVLAKNIDIELRFPASVLVSEKIPSHRIPEPNMPNPPYLGYLHPMTWSYDNRYPDPRPAPNPTLKITAVTGEPTVVEFHVETLKQQKDAPIPTLYVTYKPDSDIRGFNIEYSLRAENVPAVVEGTLNVNVKLKTEGEK
jgi:hypothetical protein